MFEPTLGKILDYFMAHPQGATHSELTNLPGVYPEYVQPALDKMLQGDVLYLEAEVYKPKEGFTEFASVFHLVCLRVNQTEERQLLVRGLLVGASKQGYLIRMESLVRVFDEESFDHQETLDFLTEEMETGYLSKIKVCFRSEGPVFTPPPFLPLSYIYYSTHGYLDDYEIIKERWRQRGLFVKEDDYLMADYPPELVAPAKQYLDEKKTYLRDRLRREAYYTSL